MGKYDVMKDFWSLLSKKHHKHLMEKLVTQMLPLKIPAKK
jgi:hypothetical protein